MSSPDELRAAADEMDEWTTPNNAFDICLIAARRLADVIEYAELRGDWIDRQYLAFARREVSDA